jgi:hypothetical protein
MRGGNWLFCRLSPVVTYADVATLVAKERAQGTQAAADRKAKAMKEMAEQVAQGQSAAANVLAGSDLC